MRFFIFALCINIILLALPIKIEKENFLQNKPSTQPPLQAFIVSENFLSKQKVENIENQDIAINKKIINQDIKKQNKQSIKKIKNQTLNRINKNHKHDKENLDLVDTENVADVLNNNVRSYSDYQTSDVLGIDDDFCRQNIIFNDIDNSYPKKAKMLKKRGKFDVTVRFSVNERGLKIIELQGDSLFVKHTEQLLKNLRYKIKDKRAYRCIFIKTIRFELGK